jgi:hypothetical protein
VDRQTLIASGKFYPPREKIDKVTARFAELRTNPPTGKILQGVRKALAISDRH